MIPAKKLKVVILTHGGCGVFLELLAASELVEIAGVYFESPSAKPRGTVEKLKRSLRYDGYFATSRKFYAIVSGKKTTGEMELEQIKNNQTDLIDLCDNLGIKTHTVPNFHDSETKEMLSSELADIGIIYGTNIIRKSVFSIPEMGSVNMHQGLAPIYRGGPAIFWELFNNAPEVGITVHMVQPQVDTGEIILQTTVPLEYDYHGYGLEFERFIEDFRLKMIAPAAELMVSAIENIAAGNSTRTPQDPTQGTRYRLPTKNEKSELIRRLRRRMKQSRGARVN